MRIIDATPYQVCLRSVNLRLKESKNKDSGTRFHRKEWRVDWDQYIVEKQVNLLVLMFKWINHLYGMYTNIFNTYFWTVQKYTMKFNLMKPK